MGRAMDVLELVGVEFTDNGANLTGPSRAVDKAEVVLQLARIADELFSLTDAEVLEKKELIKGLIASGAVRHPDAGDAPSEAGGDESQQSCCGGCGCGKSSDQQQPQPAESQELPEGFKNGDLFTTPQARRFLRTASRDYQELIDTLLSIARKEYGDEEAIAAVNSATDAVMNILRD